MSIVIELAQEEETLIRTAAGQEGVDPATYIAALVRNHLLQQKAQRNQSQSSVANGTQPSRVGNLHPGNFQTGDDFDDPLPDEFWFGEP